MVAQRAGTPPPAPVLLAGIVPPLADSYYQRPETGLALRNGVYPGDTVVLTHGKESELAPAAQGGTGKTQLAVAYTHALWSMRAVEVLIWVTATSREAIITGYAEAADAVGAAKHGTGAEAAADRLVAWLAHTRHPWALVIDDLSDPGDLENLWPAGPAGQVVITTRLPGDALRSAPGLRIAPGDRFNRREALSYLSSRLTDYPDQRMEALELGEDLDGLPLGLAQAAAVMKVSRLSCREYRAQFAERREHMSRVPVYGVSPAVLLMHPSVQAAVRAYLPPTDLEQAQLAAADALIQAWPESGGGGQLDQALRNCSSALWPPGAGSSPPGSRVTDAMRILGASHPTTMAARENLASGLMAAQRAGEAIEQRERLLADTEAAGGPAHPGTIAARAGLAAAYLRAGRPIDAIQQYERALADGEHYLGPDHPVTMTVRANRDAARV